MTYEEIESLLKEHGQHRIIERLRVAVGEEAGEITKEGDQLRLAQAREYYAEDISEWLTGNKGLEPDPRTLLDHRSRYVESWAFAEIIRPFYAPDDPEEEEPEEMPIGDQVLLRICDANSQLGLALVGSSQRIEVLSKAASATLIVDRIKEALDSAGAPVYNELGNRKLEVWERVEAILVKLKEMEDGR